MSLSDKLNQLAEKTLESDIVSKKFIELSTQKYELQKSLLDLKSILSIKQDDYDRVKNYVISLRCELPGWLEQAQLSKNALENLMKELAEQEEKTSKLQSIYWKTLNDWVDCTSQYFLKNNNSETEANIPLKPDENGKEEKIRQLKLEGQLEALRAYEKYQIRKIREIEEIGDLAKNVDDVPFFCLE